MSSKRKYAPDLNWEDLSTFVRDQRDATGSSCVVVLHFQNGPGATDWAEARIVPPLDVDIHKAQVVARGAVPARQTSRIVPVLLHLVAQAYRDLEAFPWLWSDQRRKAARGEDA